MRSQEEKGSDGSRHSGPERRDSGGLAPGRRTRSQNLARPRRQEPAAVESLGQGGESAHRTEGAEASDASSVSDRGSAEGSRQVGDEGREAGGGRASLPPPADGAGSSDGAELSRLVHAYRRLVRRVQNAEETLEEFSAVADSDSAEREAESVATLRAQLDRDRGELRDVLSRVEDLKGEAYVDALVAKYGDEQESGGWEMERSASHEPETRGGGMGLEAERDAADGFQVETEELDAAVPGQRSSPDGDGTRYELHLGDYADIYLDTAFLDFEGTLDGTLGALADAPEIAMELRNADGFEDVARVVSQLDPENFEVKGEIGAALDLLRATLTVEGAPAAVNLGGQDFLCEWMATLSARAYAEIYASGQVSPDLGDMNLEAFGEAGAAALVEGSASALVNADWMGDAYGPLADVRVEASGAAGAAAAAHGRIAVGMNTIEISGGTSLVWGLGGRVQGDLRVAVLPTLELIAEYLGVSAPSLPDPLDQIYDAFRSGEASVGEILDAWQWLIDQKPLELLADLLTSEEFWALFDRLVEQGTEAIDVVGWLSENYLQLDDEPTGVTFREQRYESAILWYACAYGEDFLRWVQELSKGALAEVLPVLREFSRATLTLIVEAGPWIAELCRDAWQGVAVAAEILGDRLEPVIRPLRDVFVLIWNEVGEPGLRWALDLAREGASWIAGVVATHGPEILEFLRGLPAAVQEFFERMGSEAVSALYEGGDYLVQALEALGDELLEYLEAWAPGVAGLFAQFGQDLYDAVTEHGGAIIGFALRIGGDALSFTGEQLKRVAAALVDTTQDVLEALAKLADAHLMPFLDLVDTQGGEFIERMAEFLATHGGALADLLAAKLPEFLAFAQRIGSKVWDELERLGELAAPFLEFALEAQEEVLEWLEDAFSWLVPHVVALREPAIHALGELEEFLADLWEVGEEHLGRVLEIYGEGITSIVSLLKQEGAEAAEWFLELSDDALAILREGSSQAVASLVAAGGWTRELVEKVGEPLLPVAERYSEALTSLGEAVGSDLIEAWDDYGAPVLVVMLEVGDEVWSNIGVGLSEILPVVDRFARDGAESAQEFIQTLLMEKAAPAAELLTSLSSEALTALYDEASAQGAALAETLSGHVDALSGMAAEEMERVLLHALDLGEWALERGEDLTGPSLEVVDEFAPRYRERFRKYGENLVHFFVVLGETGAELIDEFNDVVIDSFLAMGSAVYEHTAEFLASALRAMQEVGDWLWEHLERYREPVLEVLEWATQPIIDAWRDHGAPVVRFCIELGAEARRLARDHAERLFALVVSLGESLWTLAREEIPQVLDRLLGLGGQVVEGVRDLGQEALAIVAQAAQERWEQLAEGWERVGRPAVEFAVGVGEDIWELLGDLGEELWSYAESGAEALYWLYTEYAVPGMLAALDRAEAIGHWVWERFESRARAQVDLVIELSAPLIEKLQGWSERAWEAAAALGREMEEVWDSYGSPILMALHEAGQAVVDVYQTYAAPVVEWAIDAMWKIGARAWDVASTLGADAIELSRAIGSSVYGFLRERAEEDWQRLVGAGETVWGLCGSAGSWVLEQWDAYGSPLLDFGRTLTEDTIAAVGELAALQLRNLLEGGEAVLDALEEGGAALVELITEAPELVGLLRDRGVEAGRLALEHGAELVNLLADAPAKVLDLSIEYGSALADLILYGGSPIVRALASHGSAAAELFINHGTWFVDLVVSHGGGVVGLSLRMGDRFISALQSGASWALSLVS